MEECDIGITYLANWQKENYEAQKINIKEIESSMH